MIIKTFTYNLIDSKMYILLEVGSAVVIDPNISENAEKILRLWKVKKIKIILTHEHYDHISGVIWLQRKFKCKVYCSEKCNQNIQSSLKNGSKYFNILFLNKEKKKQEEASMIRPITCCGDVIFKDQMNMTWKGHKIFLKETPGHSQGSICILVDDKYLFTGDSLLKNIPTVTNLPGSNKNDYSRITIPYLREINKNVYVYPGHGESGYIREFWDSIEKV